MTIDKHLSWGLVLIACGWVAIAMLVNGCGSNIPIGEAPTCVEQVTDECVPEVIAEFCDNCSCDLDAAYNEGYVDGFETASDLCAANRPEACPPCEDDEDSDKKCKHHDHGKHKGWYKNGRTDKPKCDKNCDPNDPICIPCRLEVATRTCRTTCRITPLQQQECVTICTGTDEAV